MLRAMRSKQHNIPSIIIGRWTVVNKEWMAQCLLFRNTITQAKMVVNQNWLLCCLKTYHMRGLPKFYRVGGWANRSNALHRIVLAWLQSAIKNPACWVWLRPCHGGFENLRASSGLPTQVEAPQHQDLPILASDLLALNRRHF